MVNRLWNQIGYDAKYGSMVLTAEPPRRHRTSARFHLQCLAQILYLLRNDSPSIALHFFPRHGR